MLTTIGTESHFTDMLNDLLELEYDAISAYEASIARLANVGFRTQMEAFYADHQRHIRALTTLVGDLGGEPNAGPGAKSLLTKGKVVFANMIGDKAILMAMKTNEDDTVTAYERAVGNRAGSDAAARVLRAGLEDERRHRAWIEQTIARL